MRKLLFHKFFCSQNAIIIALFVIVCIHLIYGYWRKPNSIIRSDVIEYYAYLPAAFIYGDLTLKFKEKEPEFFEYLIPPDYENAMKGLSERTISMYQKRKIQNRNFEFYVKPQHYILCESPFLLPQDMPKKDKIHSIFHKTSNNPFLHAGYFDEYTHYIHGAQASKQKNLR